MYDTFLLIKEPPQKNPVAFPAEDLEITSSCDLEMGNSVTTK